MAFSPKDSTILASASDDDTAKVCQLRHGCSGEQHGKPAAHSQVASFRGHTDSVLRVSWAPDGQLLASGMSCIW